LKGLLVNEEQYKYFKHCDVNSMMANMAEETEDGGEYRQSIPFNSSQPGTDDQYEENAQQEEYEEGAF
jgi:hypothetical protein